MEIIGSLGILWVFASLIIGAFGSDREIGFWGAFIISLLFSPLIGAIFTGSSRTHKEVRNADELLQAVLEANQILKSQYGEKTAIPRIENQSAKYESKVEFVPIPESFLDEKIETKSINKKKKREKNEDAEDDLKSMKKPIVSNPSLQDESSEKARFRKLLCWRSRK